MVGFKCKMLDTHTSQINVRAQRIGRNEKDADRIYARGKRGLAWPGLVRLEGSLLGRQLAIVGQPATCYSQHEGAAHEAERHENDTCHHQSVEDGLVRGEGGAGGGGKRRRRRGSCGGEFLEEAAIHDDVAHVCVSRATSGALVVWIRVIARGGSRMSGSLRGDRYNESTLSKA